MRVVAGLFVAGTLAASPAKAASLPVGDYVDAAFLQALTATHSPVEALASGNNGFPQSVDVRQHKDGLRFTANMNFHEGFVMFTVRPDNSVVLEKAHDFQPIVDGTAGFKVKSTKVAGSPHTYMHVADIDQTIACAALCGIYATAAGQPVEFRRDSTLHGLGADTSYSLDNDHIAGPKFDYYKSGPNGETLTAFRHIGRTLTLYPVNAKGSADYSHPIAVLRWVGEALT